MQLEKIIDATTAYLCKDPRDHIFAVLALAREVEGAPLLQPDYNASLAQVQEKLALECLYQHKTLEIFCYVDHRGPLEPNSPSWVPRWHELASGVEGLPGLPDPQPPRKPLVRRLQDEAPFSSDCLEYLKPYLTRDPRTQSDSTSSIISGNLSLKLPARIVRPCLYLLSTGEVQNIEHVKSISGTPQTSFRAYGCGPMPLQLRRTNPHQPAPSLSHWQRGANVKSSLSPSHDLLSSFSTRDGDYELRVEYEENSEEWEIDVMLAKDIPAAYFQSRRFAGFVRPGAVDTSASRTGWAGVPSTSQKGDALVAFCGWKQGFVVRGSLPKYQLVGPCLVIGDMETKPNSKIYLS